MPHISSSGHPPVGNKFHGGWQVRESRQRANEFAEMQTRRRKKSRRAVEKSQSCCMVEGVRPAEGARSRDWGEGERAER